MSDQNDKATLAVLILCLGIFIGGGLLLGHEEVEVPVGVTEQQKMSLRFIEHHERMNIGNVETFSVTIDGVECIIFYELVGDIEGTKIWWRCVELD